MDSLCRCSILPNETFLRQHRIMGQGDLARDFDTSESMKNVGIPDVSPIFHTARLRQKSAQARSSHWAASRRWQCVTESGNHRYTIGPARYRSMDKKVPEGNPSGTAVKFDFLFRKWFLRRAFRRTAHVPSLRSPVPPPGIPPGKGRNPSYPEKPLCPHNGSATARR